MPKVDKYPSHVTLARHAQAGKFKKVQPIALPSAPVLLDETPRSKSGAISSLRSFPIFFKTLAELGQQVNNPSRQLTRGCQRLPEETILQLLRPQHGLRAVVLMSGGIDSAACAHFLITQGHTLSAVFVNYGQAALEQERLSVARMSSHLKIPHQVLAAAGPKNFASGELVARNAFLAFTSIFLTGGEMQILAMGLHGGTPYYDCSPAFVKSLKHLIAETTSGHTVFVAPFIDWSKQEVYEYFCRAKLPIDSTYSCEAGTTPACGSCLSCLDRGRLGC